MEIRDIDPNRPSFFKTAFCLATANSFPSKGSLSHS
jgi:hypothetical protein